MIRALLTISTWFAAGAAMAGSLDATRMVYDVTYSGIPLGNGTLTLTTKPDDCYHYELATDPIGLVRWTYGAPKESSDFCVRDGVVVPSRMGFSNANRKKDGFELVFDFAKGVVTGGRNGPLPIKSGTLDRLSVQQAARLWVKTHIGDTNPGKFVTFVADHKRVKQFTLAIKGRGTVETPAGRFEAIQFERVDDPDTTLRFWLAPKKDYMPVKVQNIEDGDDKVSLVLTK